MRAKSSIFGGLPAWVLPLLGACLGSTATNLKAEFPLFEPLGGPPGGLFELRGLDFDPRNGQIVYARTGFAAYRSSDSGFTWDRIEYSPPDTDPDHPFQVRGIAFHPDDPGVTYALDHDRIMVSDDSGETWSDRPEHIARDHLFGLLVADTDPVTFISLVWPGQPVLRSRDFGETWADITPPEMNVNSGECEKAPSTAMIVCADRGKIHISLDVGDSWEVKKLPIDQSSSVADVAIHPTRPEVIVAATAEGFYKTEDSGNNWSLTSDRFFASTDLRFSSANPAFLYGATGSTRRVRRSSDGGDSWTELGSFTFDVTTVAVHPDDENSVLAGLDSDGIFRTSDGGLTWTEENSGFHGHNDFDLAVSPDAETDLLFVSTREGLYRRPIGSTEWTGPTPVDRRAPPRNVNVDASDSSRLVYSRYVSDDQGATWDEFNATGLIETPEIMPGTEGLVMFTWATDGIIRTQDGGLTWNLSFPIPGGAGAFAHIRTGTSEAGEQVVYASYGGSTGVFASLNGGQDWEQVLSVSGSFASRIETDALDAKHIYVFEDGSKPRKSDDFGETWNVVDPLPEMMVSGTSIPPGSNGVLAISGYTSELEKFVFYTEDGGTTWNSLDSVFVDGPSAAGPVAAFFSGLVFDPKSDKIFVGEQGSGVLVSTNPVIFDDGFE